MLILALGYADSLPQDLGIMPGLLGRSLTARHPLCQKRNRLVLCRILGVVIKLPFDQPGHAVTRGRIQQTPQIVPTTVLRHQCYHGGDVLGELLRQRHHAGTEQPALTQATTDITSIKEPFYGYSGFWEVSVFVCVQSNADSNEKASRHARIAQLVEHQYKKCVTFPSPSCANSYVKSVATKKRRCDRLMLNMGLLVCCSLPYVIISTPIIYSTVKTWFAASHNSAGSRTDRYNCLPYYTAGFE